MKTSTFFGLNFHLMGKSTLTRSIVISFLFFLFINVSTYGAAISFTGASGGNWNVAANWSGGALPTSSDSVTIAGKTVIIGNGDNVVAGCVAVQNSGVSTVGTLNILTGGTLTISSTTANTSNLIIHGGVVNNQGTLSIITKSGSNAANVILSSTSGSSSKLPSTLINTGNLTLDASLGGTTATGISLSQSDIGVQPTFTTGGTINMIPNNVKTAYVIDCSSTSAIVNGNGSITAGTSGTPLLATFIRVAGSNKSLTIDQNVTLNYVGSSLANYGIVISPNTSGSCTLVNKGTLNLSGTITNPIHVLGAGFTAVFDNQGTINGTGAPAVSASGLITFQQATCTMTNSGTINFNPTSDGSVIRAFSTSANGTFSNSGTISVGSGTTLSNAIVLGDSKTTLTNTGTINIASGSINGTASGTGNATFNNNANGVMNLTNTISGTILVGNTALVFNNNGGKIVTGATINSLTIRTGTTGAIFTSGVLSPGGDAANGIIGLTNSVSFGGTLQMNVTGIAVGGVDYDQVYGFYPNADLNINGSTLALSMNVPTPSIGTSLTLINYSATGSTITGTFAKVTGLAQGWEVVYSANAVSLKFTNVIANKLEEIFDATQFLQTTSNSIVCKEKGTLQVLSFSGQVIQSVNVVAGQVIPMTPGAYIVLYKTDSKSLVQKVML
jgi:hypothetical protein